MSEPETQERHLSGRLAGGAEERTRGVCPQNGAEGRALSWAGNKREKT